MTTSDQRPPARLLAQPERSPLDRPARIRLALRQLVGDHGFHGASMSAVAKQAGVAVGTAYVHYDSKDALVIDAYRELKEELLGAAVDGVDLALPAEARFLALWRNVHRYLAAAPERARFLLQVEVSPYAGRAHQAAMEGQDAGAAERDGDVGASGDPVSAALADVADRLIDLPPLVQFDLAVGPAIRLVASGQELDEVETDRLARACWRATFEAGRG